MISIDPIRAAIAPYMLAIKIGVLVLLVGFGLWKLHAYGEARYEAGQANVQADWDKSVEKGRVRLAELKAAAGRVTVRTETVYVDRIKTIRLRGEEIVREVQVFVPAGSAELSGGFRLFHDAAAGNQPLPDAAAITHAAPVDAQTVARTVADNYAASHEIAQRLTSLQDWVRDQCKANPPPEGCAP